MIRHYKINSGVRFRSGVKDYLPGVAAVIVGLAIILLSQQILLLIIKLSFRFDF